MKKVILMILTSFIISFNYAQFNSPEDMDSTQLKLDKIEKSLIYKTGVIELESGNAKLTVPSGFRFLDKAQSNYILTDLFGNPADSSVLGMLVPSNRSVLDSHSWFFVISFSFLIFFKSKSFKIFRR